MRKSTEQWIIDLVRHCIGRGAISALQEKANKGELDKKSFYKEFGGTIWIHIKKMGPEKRGRLVDLARGGNSEPQTGEFYLLTEWGEMNDYPLSAANSGFVLSRIIASGSLLALAYDYFHQAKYKREESERDRQYPLK